MRWRKSESGTLEPGDTFEKYTVEKLLGKGGMGAVYLVRHNVLDSFFALKVLFPDVAKKNKQFVNRFIREAKLACKIKHPNLIAVHDAGQNKTNGMYYLIMDYVSGGSVRDLLKAQGRFPVQKALAVTEQIAAALNEAYKHNMVHRDIKPDNIMFTTEGTAKLADLGIAKSTNDQDTMLTMEASVFGTPAYMSPEQAIDSSKVDCRADIYSLGIVLFEMLSGQRPYRGSGTMEILSQVVKDEDIPDIREYCPQISVEIADLIRDMTAKQLDKRLATPAELLNRLSLITVSSENIADNIGQIVNSAAEVTMPTLVKNVPVSEKQKIESPAFTMSTMVKADDVNHNSVQNDSAANSIPDVTLPIMASAKVDAEEKSENTTSESIPSANISQSPADITVTKPMPEDHNTPHSPGKASLRKWFANKKNLVLSVVSLVLLAFIITGLIAITLHKKSTPSPRVNIGEKTSTTPIQVTHIPITSGVTPQKQASAQNKTEQENSVFHVAEDESAFSEGIQEDELVPNAIIILGHSGDIIKKIKSNLAKFFNTAVVFREAESFTRYRQQLLEIIKSKPKYVILIPSTRYAELNLSQANFENLIWEETALLRDNIIPFVFLLAQDNSESSKTKQFNKTLKEICDFRSIPLVYHEKDVYSSIKSHIKSEN